MYSGGLLYEFKGGLGILQMLMQRYHFGRILDQVNIIGGKDMDDIRFKLFVMFPTLVQFHTFFKTGSIHTNRPPLHN